MNPRTPPLGLGGWALYLATVGILAFGIAGYREPHVPVSPAPVPTPTLAACDREDGSGDHQVYPCVWDTRARGGLETAYPVMIYFRGSHTVCPIPAGTTAVCVDVDSWTQPGNE